MDQPDRIKELFLAALELPAAERAAFLARACAGDDAMLAELTELLAAHDDAGSFLAEPGGAVRAAVGAAAEVAETAGETIGAYKLVERIGEGTFGTVWVAEQREPVRRAVALKILKAGMDSAQVVARFEQERQALALMAHPHIAQVFDAGTTPRGRPFFVMELVKGVPLTDYVRRHGLSLQARLELFVQVCRAVQHAHGKGVIHRDLKPGNVLVATADGRSLVKVIDFGVAKATGARLTEKTLLTEHRGMVGTLAYMSPEQAEGLLDVDTRSDVYSLGAMLYELLTGGTPFDVGELREQGLREVLRLLREVDPQRPSVRVSSKGVAAWAGGPGQAVVRGDAKALFGALRGDLDWVVLKALEKERGRRYASADGLAEDVERYLAGDAVLAVPPSVGYRVRKFARRHRVGVAAGVSVAVALVIGLVVAMWGLERATASEAELIVQKRGAELDAYRANLNGSLGHASGMQHASAQMALERCSERLRGWEWSYAAAQLADAPRMLHPNPKAWAVSGDRRICGYVHGDRLVAVEVGSWKNLFNVDLGPAREVLDTDAKKQGWDDSFLALGSDGWSVLHAGQKTFVARAGENEFRLVVVPEMPSQHTHLVSSLDARKLATVDRRDDVAGARSVYVCDIEAETLIAKIPYSSDCVWEFTNDGNFMVQQEMVGEFIVVWCLRRSVQLFTKKGPSNYDARSGLLIFGDGSYDVSSSGVRLVSPTLDMSRSDDWLAWQFDDERSMLSRDFRVRPDMLLHGNPTRGECRITKSAWEHQHQFIDWFTRDCKWGVGDGGGSSGGSLRCASGRPLSVWLSALGAGALALAELKHSAGPSFGVRCVAKAAALYEFSGGHVNLPCGDARLACGSSLRSHFLAATGECLVIEDPATGKPITHLSTDAASIQAIALSCDGNHAAACDPNRIRIWHVDNPADLRQVPLSGPLPSPPILAVRADHIALATGNVIRLISIADPDRSLEYRLEHGTTTSLQFEPDGLRLLVGTSTGRALMLHTKTMTPTSELIGHQQPVRALAWNHDGSRAFTAGDDGTIRVWYSVRDHGSSLALELLSLSESSIAGKPTCLLFPPDGERLICGYDDGSLRVWDSVSWSERVDRRNAAAGAAGK